MVGQVPALGTPQPPTQVEGGGTPALTTGAAQREDPAPSAAPPSEAAAVEKALDAAKRSKVA